VENPDLDVFWDGDEYAICSRPKAGSGESSEEDNATIDQVR
jgi:hypothetical protein